MSTPRVVLLTTDTTHHLLWARELAREMAIASIFLEAPAPPPPFPVAHTFEADRDGFERGVLGEGPGWSALAEVHGVTSINDPAARGTLRALRADVTLVFGTRRLAPETVAVSGACLNLHGGDPEHYRGLDTHLWAIYHGEFHRLVTTLHVVDRELDTGAIVAQSGLPLEAGMGLHQLRLVNTRACIELSLRALGAFADSRPLAARPQTTRGRYYSAMPSALKDVCVSRFARHVASL
ncbi:MAG: formyltransferase family protein [Vicinamibacterales bacterium]